MLDRFEYRGVHIWWSGWRMPVNQDVGLGWWTARVPPDEYARDMVVSTTGGIIQRHAEMNIVDNCLRPGWPLVTVNSPEAEREHAKRRALAALVEHLCG